jgi:adenylylsulfate kinase
MGTVVHEHESNMRSIMKSITFRILATITTMILVYIFFGRLDLAAVIGALEIVLKLILYFFHERAWDRVSWGKIVVESGANGS